VVELQISFIHTTFNKTRPISYESANRVLLTFLFSSAYATLA